MISLKVTKISNSRFSPLSRKIVIFIVLFPGCFEDDVAYVGNDVGFIANIADAVACQAECQARSDCSHFTLDPWNQDSLNSWNIDFLLLT